jgi:hypothetical protein
VADDWRHPNVAYILIGALSFGLLYLALGGIPNRQTFGLNWEDEEPSHTFAHSMSENAENLLNYIVEAGIKVDGDVLQRLLEARHLGDRMLEDKNASALIAAMSNLANKVQPVTVTSLRACQNDAHRVMRRYELHALMLVAIIIPLSMFSFVGIGISNTITEQLKIANDLVVKLHTQFDTSGGSNGNRRAPSGTLTDLQQFTMAMRAIYGRAQLLDKWFVPVPFTIADPYNGSYKELELPSDLKDTVTALQEEVNHKTVPYQNIRLYATSVQDAISLVWGAISTYLLPVLYALLGAYAKLLQVVSDQLRTRTFIRSDITSAQFVIAAIGGMIVGLFNNFVLGQGASLSPLAIAFLVGYAADTFFSYLAQYLPKAKPSISEPAKTT